MLTLLRCTTRVNSPSAHTRLCQSRSSRRRSTPPPSGIRYLKQIFQNSFCPNFFISASDPMAREYWIVAMVELLLKYWIVWWVRHRITLVHWGQCTHRLVWCSCRGHANVGVDMRDFRVQEHHEGEICSCACTVSSSMSSSRFTFCTQYHILPFLPTSGKWFQHQSIIWFWKMRVPSLILYQVFSRFASFGWGAFLKVYFDHLFLCALCVLLEKCLTHVSLFWWFASPGFTRVTNASFFAYK